MLTVAHVCFEGVVRSLRNKTRLKTVAYKAIEPLQQSLAFSTSTRGSMLGSQRPFLFLQVLTDTTGACGKRFFVSVAPALVLMWLRKYGRAECPFAV